MEILLMNGKNLAMDNGLIDNRSKLLRLAETVKPTRRNKVQHIPRHTKGGPVHHKEDPSYTNIEHLVFTPCRTNTPNNASRTSQEEHLSPATSTPIRSKEIPSDSSRVDKTPTPGCYHSLDRSRLLSSGPKDVVADSRTNITLLRVEYLPPSETSTALEGDRGRGGRSMLSRNQQKTPVHVTQRPPTQRSLSDVTDGSAATKRSQPDKRVIINKDRRSAPCTSSIPCGTKLGLKSSLGSTKTIIKIGAADSTSVYRDVPKPLDSDTSSSSLNSSVVSSVVTDTSPSIHLSDESSDDVSTPATCSIRTAPYSSSSTRPSNISRVPQATTTNTCRPSTITHNSCVSKVTQERAKCNINNRIPQKQTMAIANRREIGKKMVTLSDIPTGTSSRHVVNKSMVDTSSPRGTRNSFSENTSTSKMSPKMQTSRIPGRSSMRSSVRSSITKQQKKESVPKCTTQFPKQTNLATAIHPAAKAIAEQKQVLLESQDLAKKQEQDSAVTLVKQLPPQDTGTTTTSSSSSSSRGSPERYTLEKPSRALYTWYETRRRPSLVTLGSTNFTSDAIATANNKSVSATCDGRKTASLPKSLPLDKVNRSKAKTPFDTNDPTLTENDLSKESIAQQPSSRSYSEFANRQLNSAAMQDKTATSHAELTSASQQEVEQAPVVLFKDDPPPSVVPSDDRIQQPVQDSPQPQRLSLADKPACCKALRRLKASSSPGALTVGIRPEMSASEGDLRRPWSQLYSEAEAARALEGASCTDLRPPTLGGHPSHRGNPHPAPSETHIACKGMLLPPFATRCSSLRVPNHQPLSVLQKFRKSFSLRFYRNKGSGPVNPQLSDRPPTPFPSAAGSEGSASTFSVASAAEEDDEGETLFRLGPLVWRSSKDKKPKNGRAAGGSSANCSSPDSGIQVEGSPRRVPAVCPGTPPSTWASCSPSPLARRGQSSLRLERPPRPLSEAGSACSSFTMLDHKVVNSEDKKSVRRTFSDLGGTERCSRSQTEKAIPPLVKMRSEKRISIHRLRRRQGNLRRSISQPMDMEKMSSFSSLSQGLSDVEDNANDCATSSDDESLSEGEQTPCFHSHRWTKKLQNMEYVTYAEALWDHVTLDPQELPLKVGDLVAVLDCTNRHWWVGALGSRIGWFPAAFVRPKVHQEDMDESFSNNSIEKSPINGQDYCKNGTPSLSNEQVRTNVVQEIIATERDYVKHLKDVIEGYLKQMRRRIDMFTEERINVIFGNIEQILIFQNKFLTSLENCIDWNNPHLSQVGSCFVEHKEGFQVYSDYCNNHPRAANELQELFTIPKYAHFFEACRLLQDMIDISLDGFLLTPIQKICKYPLQLAELLKYTPIEHPDRLHVEEALESMRQVALYINERKRRMECLEKLASWQMSVEYWEGPNLLEHSSQLIHSGDVSKLSSAWSRDLTLFLFDHQLIMCKKDLLKRNTYCYKSRINMDESEVLDLPDGRDTQSGLTVKHAWRLHCRIRDKWYTFCSKTFEEKSQWMKAFQEERHKVTMDKIQGFKMSEKAKAAAIVLANNRLKRSKSKNGKEFRSWRLPPVNLVHHPAMKGKTSSLPHGVLLKKKHSGWFAFGSNKKHKR